MSDTEYSWEVRQLDVLSSRLEPPPEAETVEFRILGPLEVVCTDEPLDLRGAKRRGLIALLAVHAGQWLSLDRIVEELWGDEPAAGASRTVQTYVSQLRKIFDGTSLIIVQREGGYQLDVPLDRIDAWRFEQAIRMGSDATDPNECLHSMNEALGLWRGSPLQEFDHPWAVRERSRLELLHLQALDAEIDARLTLGGDRAVVSELEQLVENHPLDERFWAKLLVAYYRSGRQADALQAFQRVRSMLAQELGIDPGPELVELEQRILQQDDTLLLRREGISATTDALPTGTVTFLFTDIADSTRLWEEQTDEMADAISQHHQVLTTSIQSHNGHVVKTIGDGLMAVFAEATDAVTAAIDAQLVIARTKWAVLLRVRMGMHTGPAHLVDGDYHAPAVNRAARVAAIAHPEQILVSAATAALTEEVSLRDLGEHRLRGLAPIRLFQVLAPTLPETFPANESALAITLPTFVTSFVGRASDLASVVDLVHEHRMVTLTGTGGCGKTRLAAEAAHRLAHDFADGVRFVDLAPVSQDSGVDEAVLDALGLGASPDSDVPRRRVTSYLVERAVIVVLDNCEHLLDACADLAEAVLARGGQSRILATSREPLGLVSEHVFVVPSLDVETDAVTLFVDRAEATGSQLATSDEHREQMTQICRRLDGIPLAIELAAARTTHLSPAQMLDRLDDRFRLLTGGQRRIQRHQTLAATLDWSHDLLDPEDRTVLRRLAVFPASFTLEAAEAVVDRRDVVERLGSLVTKSLVQTIAADGMRYRLLESVRVYAEAKLVQADEAATTRTRHCRWVHEWLESMPLGERILGDDDVLGAELPNVRAALEWSAGGGDVVTAADIASGVDWSRTEGWPDAFRACEQLIARPGLSRSARLRLALMLWWLAPIQRWSYNRARAQPILDHATPDAGALYAVALSATARDLIIPAVESRDDAMRQRAMELAEQSVAASVGCETPWRMYCRMIAGMTYASFRQPARAAEHFAADRANVASYHDLDATLDAYQAIMCLVIGDDTRAFELAESAFSPRLVPYWSHARPVCLVALAAKGDTGRARQALREYFEIARSAYWVYSMESVVLLGGVIAGLEGDWITASRTIGGGGTGCAPHARGQHPLLHLPRSCPRAAGCRARPCVPRRGPRHVHGARAGSRPWLIAM